MKVARLTLSDRASAGTYEDLSGPEIERVLSEAGFHVSEWIRHVMPDDQAEIEALLRTLCDGESPELILTTGGTGPSARDNTPEATKAVLVRRASPASAKRCGCGASKKSPPPSFPVLPPGLAHALSS